MIIWIKFNDSISIESFGDKNDHFKLPKMFILSNVAVISYGALLLR